MSALADIGQKAIAYYDARMARAAARKLRNESARAFHAEHGGAAGRDDDGELSAEFIAATQETQEAYIDALSRELSARAALHAAIRKAKKAGAA